VSTFVVSVLVLVACGVLKITYDLLLLGMFRSHPVD